jgi:hypothetical protein
MWGILVGLIERWWREKPRKDIVRAVVRLRDSMIECQGWYSEYREALKANDIDRLSPNPKWEWFRSLDDLTDSVAELDDVLAIFSPEAHRALAGYILNDSQLAGPLALRAALLELDKSAEVDMDLAHYGANYSEIGITEEMIESGFSEALTELRKFISENFKPDEVFAASENKRSRFVVLDKPHAKL